MKQTVLGVDKSKYRSGIRTDIILCICVLCAVALAHVLCISLRTDSNHRVMLAANIAADIIGGSFVITRVYMHILPERRLLLLYDSASQIESGVVREIAKDPVNYVGISCREVDLGDRRLFLPIGDMSLIPGEAYTFRLKGNVIAEAEHGA